MTRLAFAGKCVPRAASAPGAAVLSPCSSCPRASAPSPAREARPRPRLYVGTAVAMSSAMKPMPKIMKPTVSSSSTSVSIGR